MAQLLHVHTVRGAGDPLLPAICRPKMVAFRSCGAILVRKPQPRSDWEELQKELKGEGRHSCFFGDGRKQEQARKALEGALGEKKTEFDKWNKEIEKRESSGGGASGRGGWFGGGGGGGWFGWSSSDQFWDETKQAGITILGLVSLYLLLTKGDVIFAVIFNSLLFPLRGVRNGFEFILSRITGKLPPATPAGEKGSSSFEKTKLSAKERVISKWRTD